MKIPFLREYRVPKKLWHEDGTHSFVASFMFFALCGIFAILAGSMIATIGSRSIAKQIEVSVTDSQGLSLPSVQVYAQLARSKNITLTQKNPHHAARWSIDAVFVEKILIGITKDDKQRAATILVSIGNKDFSFATDDLFAGWDMLDTSSIQSYVPDSDIDTYMLFAAPPQVYLEASQIPIKKEFFASLINWGGDYNFFIQPLSNAYPIVILYILALVGVYTILISYTHNKSKQSDDFNVSEQKKEYITILATTLCSLSLLSIVVLCIHAIYTPDIASILRNVPNLYLDFQIPAFLPKPVERLQFVLGALITTCSVPVFYYFLKKKIYSFDAQRIDALYTKLSVITASVLLVFVYLGLSMSNFLYVSSSFFFDTYGRFAYTLIIFPALLFVLLVRPHIIADHAHTIRITLQTIILIAFCVIFITSIHTLGGTFSEFHINPLLYPIAQVLAGKTLLVDITSLYGLFPLFVTPIFKLFGLGIFSFSILLGTLTITSFLLILHFMRRVIATEVIAYAGFIAMLFYAYLTHGTETTGIYFQYWPIRLLFPALFLYLTSIYMLTEKKTVYFFSLVAISLSVLWNFDTGLFVFLSWIAVLAFHEFSKPGPLLGATSRLARHIFFTFVSLLSILACFAAYTYITSGSLPSIPLFFMYQKLFLSGYFMIPLPPPLHLWGISVLIYLVGLITSVSALFKTNVKHVDKVIFMLSLLGIGLLIYYEGRSHDYTLFGPSYPAFILMALYADRLYTHIRTSAKFLYGHTLIFILLFFIIAVAPFSVLSNLTTYAHNVRGVLSGYATQDSSHYAKDIQFIKDHTERGEAIFILARNKEALYYAETETHAAPTLPSSTDMFFISESETMVNFLVHNTTVKVFAEHPITFNDLYDTRIALILSEQYEVKSTGETGLLLLEKKR